MSTRSYSNLIVLESLYDSIPTINADVLSLAASVFTPYVPVVSTDCGTTLGQIVDVTFEVEGKVELATGLVISHARIIQLLEQGIYKTSIRDLSTCIESDGVCQKCYHASRQYEPVPAIGSVVQIHPEYVTYTETIILNSGDSVVLLSQDESLYDRIYVYMNGMLVPPSSYTITNSVLQLSSAATNDGYLVARYTSIIRAPYLFWLASTYSGSMLGIKELPAPALILRKRLLTALIPKSVLELVSNNANNLKGITPEALEYLPHVVDPLEKALFVIALYAVYLNVN
jgi:hypothetical protein